jgi:hypothetical protein
MILSPVARCPTAYNRPMPKNDGFQATFKTLRALLKPYEPQFVVIADEPGRYYLATKTWKTRSGSAIWFGGVEIMRNYVSLHLMPVYGNPALLKGASPSLLKRKQGKSCFNFTRIDPAHVEELAAITKRGVAGFVKKFP